MAFNELTDEQVERLDILAEEAAEVIVAISKIKRHGYLSYNPDVPSRDRVYNKYQLEVELADLVGVMDEMCARGDLSGPKIEARGKLAWAKKLKYTHHQPNT